MDKPKPPIFTEHRRKRLTLWALTVLGWLMSALIGERDAHHRHLKQRLHHICLDHLTRTVIALVVARALQAANVRMRWRVHYSRRGRSMRRAHFMRSFIGGRFRRLLKHKDLSVRIARLIAVLHDLDAHARCLAKRVRKLRRLWRELPPIAACEALLGAPAATPALADSS